MMSHEETQIKIMELAKLQYLASVLDHLNSDAEDMSAEFHQELDRIIDTKAILIDTYFATVELAPGAKNNKDVAGLKARVQRNAVTRNNLVEKIVKMEL